MVDAITGGDPAASTCIIGKLREREKSGSTFLNEGVALPHARVERLDQPQIAVGLTHGGVMDSPAEAPIEVVFMLLTPAEGAARTCGCWPRQAACCKAASCAAASPKPAPQTQPWKKSAVGNNRAVQPRPS